MTKNAEFDQFKGSADYIASEPLRNAVNVTIALQRPLLIRGEPGTGKTLLAHSIAQGIGKRLIICLPICLTCSGHHSRMQGQRRSGYPLHFGIRCSPVENCLGY